MLFTVSILFLFFEPFASADAPAQDPLCDTSIPFAKVLDQSRGAHLQSPLLRWNTEAQTKWFGKVSGQMKAFCTEEQKFAAEILKRDRSGITGQCKPAAEAALYDQDLLEHSEKSLALVKSKLGLFFDTGPKRTAESLWDTYERNYKQVNSKALELGDVPRIAACELRWIYPKSFLDKKPFFDGCTETPTGISLGDSDKGDPGVFGRIMGRYRQSVQYNTSRRDLARSTAQASRARYEACIAQFPGTENVLAAAKGKAAAGAAKPVPNGSSNKKGSDITGTKEDEQKRMKK